MLFINAVYLTCGVGAFGQIYKKKPYVPKNSRSGENVPAHSPDVVLLRPHDMGVATCHGVAASLHPTSSPEGGVLVGR